MQSINVRHAVITGGGSGLGLSMAKKLASRGVSVTILDIIDTSAAEDAIRKVSSGSASVAAIQTDTTKPPQVEEALRFAEQKSGPVDMLVACAGIYRGAGRIWHTPVNDFAQTMGVNYLGVVHSVKAVLPGMLERGRGRILLVSSILGCAPAMCASAYACSKAAVKAFADVLRLETLGSGVTVHIALPGGVDTPMLDRFNVDAAEVVAAIQASRILRIFFPEEKPIGADEVTTGWMKAIERGHYMLPFPGAVPNVVAHVQAGLVAPGLLAWPLDFLLSGFLALFKAFARYAVNALALELSPSKKVLPASQGNEE